MFIRLCAILPSASLFSSTDFKTAPILAGTASERNSDSGVIAIRDRSSQLVTHVLRLLNALDLELQEIIENRPLNFQTLFLGVVYYVLGPILDLILNATLDQVFVNELVNFYAVQLYVFVGQEYLE